MSVKALKKLLGEIDYAVLIEVVDSCWCAGDSDYQYHWNTDDDEDELEYGDGSTYSIEAMGGYSEYDGYRVVNGRTGCGETVTYFFNLEKEVEF